MTGSTTLGAPPAPLAGAGPRTSRTARIRVAQVRRIGYGLFALQFVGLAVWSSVLAHRFALSLDFSIYHQAWWSIGHGNLNPFDSPQGYPFWQAHGEFIYWPLALLGDVWPHPVTHLWFQDAFLVAAGAVAFSWLCRFALDGVEEGGPSEPAHAAVLAGTGAVLLVANPWIYWSASFDVHTETIGVLFIVLLARQLWSAPGHWSVWLWAGLGLACGDVIATYVAAVGVSAVLAGPRWRRRGAVVAAAGVAWSLVLTAIGAHQASELANYGYLATGSLNSVPTSHGAFDLAKGALSHPGTIVRALWQKRVNLYAVVATSGLIGIVSPWVVAPVVLILLENGLDASAGLSVPSFQSALIFVLVPVGTVGVLAVIARRRRRLALGLAALVAVNTVAWGLIWIPRTATQWLRVSPGAAAVLSSVHIPADQQVIASQGVAGGFAEHTWVEDFFQAGPIAVHTDPVWVVIAPDQGIETIPTTVSAALIHELAGPLHAELVAHGDGVWIFRWTPPPGTRALTVPATVLSVPAWTATGVAGAPVTVGPESDWRAVGTGDRGYVVSGSYWRKGTGTYRATVTLATTVPTNIEVWNSTSNELLARRSVPATDGEIAVTMDAVVAHEQPEAVYRGLGPFSISPVLPPPGNALEVRVWSPGGGSVSVSSLELVRVGPE